MNHKRYEVKTAGTSICVDCSNRIGWAIDWETAEACGHDRFRILSQPV